MARLRVRSRETTPKISKERVKEGRSAPCGALLPRWVAPSGKDVTLREVVRHFLLVVALHEGQELLQFLLLHAAAQVYGRTRRHRQLLARFIDNKIQGKTRAGVQSETSIWWYW